MNTINSKSVKKSKKTQNYFSEEFELCDGNVRVFRVKSRSGEVWQFRSWLEKEKKYSIKSLKTKDKKLATKRAIEHYEELKSPVKKKSKTKHHFTDKFEVYDGDVVVYRTALSGKVWQFRCWIQTESKYYKKSLRTKDRELATERARELFIEIHAKIKNKQQVFDKTVQQLCDVYLTEQKKRIRTGASAKGKGNIGITKGRFVTIRTQIQKHLVGFLGEQTKLSTIIPTFFKNDYTVYRRKKNPTVQDVTIINERATIGNCFKYAFELGWVKFNELHWEEMSKNASKRDAFNLEEWREIYKYLGKWTNQEKDEHIIEEKNFIKNFILILVNSGLRFGELRELRWSNVKVLKTGEKSNAVIDVHISKTGRRENVVGRRGELFNRVRKLTKFKNPSDYIFINNHTGEQISDKVYYRHWDEIIQNTSLKEKLRKPSYYCLRHTYATFRLYANVPVFDLAKNMGCSVKFIEDHYGHVQQLKRSELLTKDFTDEGSKMLIGFD